MTDSINPFESDCKFFRETYSSFVNSQISNLHTGDSVKADLGGKTAEQFRATLRYVSKELKVKIKTKSDFNGDIWVLRIS